MIPTTKHPREGTEGSSSGGEFFAEAVFEFSDGGEGAVSVGVHSQQRSGIHGELPV